MTQRKLSIKKSSVLLWGIACGVWLLVLVFMILFRNGDWRGAQSKAVQEATQSTSGIVQEEKPSVFAEELHPIYAAPVKLIITSLNIDMSVIEVLVDEKGYLEAPKDWKVGGWYKKGAKPGESGNLIINGHYDDNYGRPAAFWQLKNVKVNDTVDVIDAFGKTYSYRITESFYLDINDPDRLKIFDSDKSKSVITLITCGGVWVPNASTYNKRLVVKGEFIN